MLPLSALITAFAQLGVLLVLPAAWWALTARRSLGFAAWIGLRAPQWHGGWVRAVVAGLAWALASVTSVVLLRSTSEGTAVSGFAGTGLAGVVPVLLHAVIQTALSEEILFRGFLGKRLISRFGSTIGNTAQAVVFGLMHVALFASFVPPLPLALIGAVTAANGWITGWINEECAGGSIVPSWLLHATANLAVGWGAAFGLLS